MGGFIEINFIEMPEAVDLFKGIKNEYLSRIFDFHELRAR